LFYTVYKTDFVCNIEGFVDFEGLDENEGIADPEFKF
jgi:hypothetical protein